MYAHLSKKISLSLTVLSCIFISACSSNQFSSQNDSVQRSIASTSNYKENYKEWEKLPEYIKETSETLTTDGNDIIAVLEIKKPKKEITIHKFHLLLLTQKRENKKRFNIFHFVGNGRSKNELQLLDNVEELKLVEKLRNGTLIFQQKTTPSHQYSFSKTNNSKAIKYSIEPVLKSLDEENYELNVYQNDRLHDDNL